MNFRETVLWCAAFGFVGGWAFGVFLSLWCYISLGL